MAEAGEVVDDFLLQSSNFVVLGLLGPLVGTPKRAGGVLKQLLLPAIDLAGLQPVLITQVGQGHLLN